MSSTTRAFGCGFGRSSANSSKRLHSSSVCCPCTTFSIGGMPGFQVGAGANYRDRTWSDTTNVNSVPAYVIGNAMIGWENSNWGVALNVKNITNERYFVAANGAGGFVGEGLSAFLTVRYRE